MIILRKKLFSINHLNSFEQVVLDDITFIQPILNIIKAVEMWEFDEGRYVNHWINLMAGRLVMLKFINDLDFSPQTTLIGLEDDIRVIRKVIGSNNADLMINRYGNPKEIIDHAIYRMLNDTRKSGDLDVDPKYYSKWFKSKNPNQCLRFTSKEHLVFLKYVALCISGQINPFMDTEYYGNIRKINVTKVDYFKYIYVDSDAYSLNNVIVKCIENLYCGYRPKLVEDL